VKNGIVTNADLQARTAKQLLSLWGFGVWCLAEVEQHLERLGLALAPPVVAETCPSDFIMLTLRTRNRLAEAGIATSGELCAWSATQLLSVHGFGRACLGDVERYLERLDLRLAPDRRPRSRRLTNSTNAKRLRRLIRRLLGRGPLVRGTQSRLAKQCAVSKQRVHQLVHEERDRQERGAGSAT
jgi:hypothetical protein